MSDSDGRRRTYEWADPAPSAAAARELDGLSFFREMIAGRIPPPPITATLGFGWVSIEPGKVVFEITPAEYHYNPIGSVHGGVFATLLDSAAGCAVHSTLPAGVGYTSVDLNVKFLRGMTTDTGRVTCEGRVVHRGRRMVLAEATLTDGRGRLLATATSSCLVFDLA